ncbi:MAG: hypothetical protein ABS58_08655 [Mesorhizobium sp. SCN 65-20]|nr:MAG: hypothetical protein ABS58_08655 [Mesorhizobium sp. SCN 65-20]
MTRKPKPQLARFTPNIKMAGDDVPLELHNAFALAYSIAATMEGAHLKCQRRECRSYNRCRASPTMGRSEFCPIPLGREAERRMEGMFLFALQLANDWR